MRAPGPVLSSAADGGAGEQTGPDRRRNRRGRPASGDGPVGWPVVGQQSHSWGIRALPELERAEVVEFGLAGRLNWKRARCGWPGLDGFAARGREACPRRGWAGAKWGNSLDQVGPRVFLLIAPQDKLNQHLKLFQLYPSTMAATDSFVATCPKDLPTNAFALPRSKSGALARGQSYTPPGRVSGMQQGEKWVGM